MAIEVSEFPQHASASGKSMHNWDLWFNGKLWRLSKDEDYTCEPETLVRNLKRKAAARQIRIKASRDVRSGFVYVQKID